MSKLPTDLRLIRCPERPLGVSLPVPLSARLGVLVRIGNDCWAPTTRKEVLNALLLSAEPDAKKLGAALRRYEDARVSDAFVDGVERWRFLYPPGSRGPQRQLTLQGTEDTGPPDEPPWASPDENLSAARTYRIGMSVASPLAGRLELLVDLVGAPTDRTKIVAALILDAEPDGSRLAEQLADYWHGTVADAVIPGRPSEHIVSFPDRPLSPPPPQRRRVNPPPGRPHIS